MKRLVLWGVVVCGACTGPGRGEPDAGGATSSSSSSGGGSSTSAPGSTSRASSSSTAGSGSSGGQCPGAGTLVAGENPGNTGGASRVRTPSCQGRLGLTGGGQVFMRYTPVGVQDLLLELESATDQSLWAMDGCAGAELACVEQRVVGGERLEVRGVSTDTYIGVGAVSPGEEGPFVVRVVARPVLGGGQGCDPFGRANRCGDGLSCTDRLGSFVCEQDTLLGNAMCLAAVRQNGPGTLTGTTVAARHALQPDCVPAGNGGDAWVSYRVSGAAGRPGNVSNGAVDLLVRLDTPTEQALSVRSQCGNASPSDVCTVQREIVMENQPPGRNLNTIVSALSSSENGPFTLHFQERGIRVRSAECDPQGITDRCVTGTLCALESETQSFLCQPVGTPLLTGGQATLGDLDGDGLSDVLRLSLSGSDSDGDVMGLRLVFEDARGAPLQLLTEMAGAYAPWHSGLFLVPTLGGHVTFQDARVEFTGVDHVVNQAVVGGLTVRAVDSLGLESTPMHLIPTRATGIAQGQSCSGGVGEFCAPGSTCVQNTCRDFQTALCSSAVVMDASHAEVRGHTGHTLPSATRSTCSRLDVAEQLHTYRVQNDHVDVVVHLQADKPSGLALWTVCTDPMSEAQCAALFSSDLVIPDARSGSVLGLSVFADGVLNAGLYTLTVRERPIVVGNQPCDVHGEQNRCTLGTACHPVSHVCSTAHAPTLTDVAAARVDQNRDGRPDAIWLWLTGADADGDLSDVEVQARDVSGALVGWTWMQGAGLWSTDTIAVPVTGGMLQGQRVVMDSRDVVNLSAITRLDVRLRDATSMTSVWLRSVNLTPIPTLVHGALCDPLEHQNICAEGLACGSSTTGMPTTCLDRVEQRNLACTQAPILAANVPMTVSWSAVQDLVDTSCADPAGRDAFVAWQVGSAKADVVVDVSPSVVALTIWNNCSSATQCKSFASHVIIPDVPAQTLLRLGLSSAPGGGPDVAITALERPILSANAPCDVSALSNRCDALLQCRMATDQVNRCQPYVCGNGVLEPGEECDDHNTGSLDGCSGTCTDECRTTEAEPNAPAAPQALNIPAYCSAFRVLGASLAASDEDGYQLHLMAGQVLMAWTEGAVAGTCDVPLNTILDLRQLPLGGGNRAPSCGQADPERLRCDDDRGEGLCSRLSYQAPSDGDYLLRVWGGPQGSTYSLQLTRETQQCGNAHRESREECDDGNSTDDDGCSNACRLPNVVRESEPNEDGSPSTGGDVFRGNDFAGAQADGPFSSDTMVVAILDVPGDEDVYRIINNGSAAAQVRLETFSVDGPGHCNDGVDTSLVIRDGSGAVMREDDDSGIRPCSRAEVTVPAGATVYAQVLSFGDVDPLGDYFYLLQIDFL